MDEELLPVTLLRTPAKRLQRCRRRLFRLRKRSEPLPDRR
jgi:hypothetical protein